ncbi:MAG: hypothetical protein MUE69_10090 [Myxococcota bacterium]|nr:hypothetical protein [Myxococcota bacterium]
MLVRAWLGLVVLALLVSPARAQTDGAGDGAATDGTADPAATDGAETPPGDAIDTTDLEQSGRLGDEQVLAEERLGVEQARSGTDPYEDPTAAYFFLGAAYWHTFTPSFILNLFTDESTKTNNPGIGLQFTYRKDAFDIVTSLYYQTYAVNGPFRGAGDEDTETEIIDSDLKMVAVSVSFLWSTEFTDWFAIQYGIGLGVGGVFGDMIRTEAYRVGNGWERCVGPSNPPNAFCDPTSVADGEDGGHFGARARRWTQGGSVPNVWFRASLPHLALRFKPIKQLMIRVDGGFDLFSGFFVGGSLNFGFGG